MPRKHPTDAEVSEWTEYDEPPYYYAREITAAQITRVLARLAHNALSSPMIDPYQVAVAAHMAALSGHDHADEVLTEALQQPDVSALLGAIDAAVDYLRYRRPQENGAAERLMEGQAAVYDRLLTIARTYHNPSVREYAANALASSR